MRLNAHFQNLEISSVYKNTKIAHRKLTIDFMWRIKFTVLNNR